MLFKLYASISVSVELSADSHVCIGGAVGFDGGVCMCAVVAVAACHGDSEGVCMLQFHLVLL